MQDDNLRDRAYIKAPPKAFEDLHIARGRELKKGPNLPPSGGSDGIESVWARCKQCGFPIDLSKTNPGSPWGNPSTLSSLINVTVQM